MSETSTKTMNLKFDGSAVQGQMNLDNLLPALMGFSSVIQQINRDVNKTDKKLDIYLKATENGSFNIIVDLVAQGFIQQVAELFKSKESKESLNAILDLILKGSQLVGGASVPVFGIVKFILWRKNQPIKTEKIDNNISRVTNQITGENVFVYNYSLEASVNPIILKQLQKLISDPLAKDGIENLAISVDGDEDRKETIQKANAPYFTSGSSDKETTDQIQTEYLQLDTIQFDSDKWKFRLGQDTIWAKIEDEKFLKQIDTGEVSFSKGDILFANLKITKGFKDNRIIRETVLIEVLEVKKGVISEKIF